MSAPARQFQMFEEPPRPRVARAHVVNAGNGPGPGHWAEFMCAKCGWRSEWQHIANVTAARCALGRTKRHPH